MNIKPIKTPEDHRAALQEINGLMMAEMGSPEGDRLDVLTTLVEAYEAKHYPMEMADPVDAIKFTMEQRGLTARDLQPMIGQLNRVYEILNGKRMLTLPMIWRLHQAFGIPAEALIKPPRSLCTTV
jgi:HTH-type transcriptional regulator/antitoxin HigA